MSDLDSFFAKKDKKKVKGKKFDNLDEMAKRLEEKEKKLEKEVMKVEIKKMEANLSANTNSNQTAAPTKKEMEEEWKDFQEDEHDLTDLKLQKLQMEDEEENSYYNENGEGGSRSNEKSDGVWNKNVGPEKEPEEETQETAEPEGSTTEKQAYLAPHLRHAATRLKPMSKGKTKQAPDITNESAFPSLSDALTPGAAKPKARKLVGQPVESAFEDVKRGSSRVHRNGNSVNQKLGVQNRFGVLSDKC